MPPTTRAPVRFAVGIPNLREYADPRLIAAMARDAEAAGWDGVFVWDHLADRQAGVPATDAWIALAAAAATTSKVRLGVMVTPLSRRRPWKVARESVAMDVLSDGRFHLGVGLGSDNPAEHAAFGDEADPRVRAQLLDEGLDVLLGLWSGEPFEYGGEHHVVQGAQFRPVAVQRPRIPVWVAGRWPNRRPFRRAARYDGVFPTGIGLQPQETLTPGELGEAVRYVAERREGRGAFDVVIEAFTPGEDAAADGEVVAPYVEQGLTWWIEKLGWWRGELDVVRERVRRGPPQLPG